MLAPSAKPRLAAIAHVPIGISLIWDQVLLRAQQTQALVPYVFCLGARASLARLRPRWLREEFSGRALLFKILATLLIIAGLVLVGIHEA